MYKIGELSKLSNIPVKTLRFYDLEGLIRPDRVDEFTGYRYYSASKLSDCYRILAMKELDFLWRRLRLRVSFPRKSFPNFWQRRSGNWRNYGRLPDNA